MACKPTVFISWDQYGFFFLCNMGNVFHKNHLKQDIKDIIIPTRLLSFEDRNELVIMARASLGSAFGRNLLFEKRGHLYNRAQVSYILGSNARTEIEGYENLSDIDRMLEFFKSSKEISY